MERTTADVQTTSATSEGLSVESKNLARVDRHGWIGTETVHTPFGNFKFKNGYPTPEAADALLNQLKFNRAVEVYLTQMPAVAIIESRRGVREFGAKRPNDVVVWETLMDAETLVLTANTETVYAMGFLDLKATARRSSRPRRRCSGRRWTRCNGGSRISVRRVQTRGRAANSCSSRRDTRATCRKATSLSSRRHSASSTSCAGSKSTARPIMPYRS